MDQDLADMFGHLARTFEKRTGRKITVPTAGQQPIEEPAPKTVRLRIGNSHPNEFVAFPDTTHRGAIVIQGTVLAPLQVVEFTVQKFIAEGMKRAHRGSWLAFVIGP